MSVKDVYGDSSGLYIDVKSFIRLPLRLFLIF